MFIGKSFFRLLTLLIALVDGLAPGEGLAAISTPDRATIIHHALTVELIPALHELVAQDQVELEIPSHATTMMFTLAPTLQVESIALRDNSAMGERSQPDRALSFTTESLPQPLTQRIVVTLTPGHAERATLVWIYRGVINDPPKEPRHLRFVTPSETAGHIGSEGVYLSSESQWYPDIEEIGRAHV